jgi:Asp-tRNA(Asn)/Glu-tRNA(Gln) amidotransferase A subunit family amidase
MGHLASGLPTGLQFLGRYRGEEDLLSLAAGYEDASLNRRPLAAAREGNASAAHLGKP